MGPSLTCLSTFLTGDPTVDGQGEGDLHLRLEHTHFFGTGSPVAESQGGHYHCDVTPRAVVYEGYFVPCERLYRVADPNLRKFATSGQ